jgi:anaerobic ribonucleoside-triphosphate reductase
LSESIIHIVGDEYSNVNKKEVEKKAISTALKVASEKGQEISEKIGISIINEKGTSRFSSLDIEKYGKSRVILSSEKEFYSQSPRISLNKIFNQEIIEEHNDFFDNLNGGYSLNLDIGRDTTIDGIANAIKKLNRLRFFKPSKAFTICRNCGNRTLFEVSRCKVCKSHSIINHVH